MPDGVSEKPSWVFDREFEWSALTSFAGSPSPRARLGIVSGRRRQGKTYLLRALAEATGAFYYAAAEATTADSLRDLGAALAAHTGAALPYAIRDWNEALHAIRDTFPGGLAIIDEFPYLIRAEPALPSLLQRALDDQAWGRQARGTRFMLCGSAMSVMGGLLAGSAPLRPQRARVAHRAVRFPDGGAVLGLRQRSRTGRPGPFHRRGHARLPVGVRRRRRTRLPC